MARVGFKKHYPAGTLDQAAMHALFGHMKAFIASAGFNVLLDTADAIDFIRMGATAGTADDDIPHWAFTIEDQTEIFAVLHAYAVFGTDYLTSGAQQRNLFHQATLGNPPPSAAVTVWFAADGVAGWWWLTGLKEDITSPTGVSMAVAYAGATSRRYPADTHPGLCARYGLWDAGGGWEPPSATRPDGTLNTNLWTGTWSPFGEGWTNNGIRHPGSPLPKMAVPQFPNRDGGITACVLGEFNEILVLTDGYAQDEVVIPGWIAMVGEPNRQPYAVPAPASFTVL